MGLIGPKIIIKPLIIFKEEYKIIGLLISFIIGNSLLFILLLLGIIYYYPSSNSKNKRFIRFDMFKESYGKFYWKLAWSGVFYNIAIWIDKVIFWFSPIVGYAVIDNLHASMVYDFPIFLAYLFKLNSPGDWANYFFLIRNWGGLDFLAFSS